MHPAEDIRGTRGSSLEGKKIVLAITGSIAAVECVKLARELIRQGADVFGVMTEKAQEIVGAYSIEFATGNPVVTDITGKVEHVEMCGDLSGHADLVLVAPATANTIGKMVHGIDDTPVTTFLTTAVGTGIPVLVVPAMHKTMYDHPVVRNNIEKAKRELGVRFVAPILEERKAKMAGVEEIVENVIRVLGKGELTGKKVLIITGATREPLDDMRFLSNRATGRTGIELGRAAYRMGADVLILSGSNVCGIPDHLPFRTFSSTDDLLSMVEGLGRDWGGPDMAFFSAGISDYSPEVSTGKLPSGQERMTISMSRTPKVIERFRSLFPDSFLVGFKAESVSDENELIKRAYERMGEVGMDLVVANDLSDVSEDKNTIMLITPQKEVFRAEGKKEHIAQFIIERSLSLSGNGKQR
ncbi:MAG TPA: bifunctional phosphopantothenoylcysteine decarboxylase/phosphopantothenate--cysteine ligase CoaBC [Euryarchaeota archaeon]|nr:bifunctional phosphopantothenoylcysteine decarboxylase/phosphopantothenate--cysteine ligase CoaBC [Euryarchaeota archaeon]